ncbi:hypothetical protein [Achromobacter sp.]|uniref:tetratricopeptide repeat protein n=1 Tax=Achromobacter sp. TaxID=134375 RepID=UPI0025911E77|nr:hypothetical protein [Achromobacter sp.]
MPEHLPLSLTRRMLRAARPSRRVAIVLVAGALTCYGAVQFWSSRDPAVAFRESGDVAQLIAAVTRLEQRTAQAPQDYAAQRLLAHGYRAMGRHADAVHAFGKAWPLVQDDPDELALFAATLAISRGGFSGKPDELLQRALAADPSHANALMLKGASAYERGDFGLARRTWERVLTQGGLDDEDLEWVRAQIARLPDPMVTTAQAKTIPK